MMTAGCLTGLGLPPPAGGGGGNGAPTNQQQTDMSTADGGGAGDGGGPGSDGGSPSDGGPGNGGGGPVDDAGRGPTQFDQERWVTQQSVFLDGTKWLAGDFNDDGRCDLASVFSDHGNASIDVWLSNGTTFVQQRWATQQNGFWATQKWIAGDFDGGGFTDLANVFGDLAQISIDVHLSTGSAFTVQRWETRQGGFWDAQQWFAGDYNVDRKDDLVNVFQDMAQTSFDLHRSTGSSFIYQRWATHKAPFDPSQKWLSGLYGNYGGDVLLVLFNDMGSISTDVYMGSGTTLIRVQEGRQLGTYSSADRWFSGQFLGLGASELARLFSDDGQASIDVLTSDGETDQRWATRQGGYWDAQQWVVGDFDGDWKSDLANIFSDNGSVSIDVHRNSKP